jgi:hypothetical protein
VFDNDNGSNAVDDMIAVAVAVAVAHIAIAPIHVWCC